MSRKRFPADSLPDPTRRRVLRYGVHALGAIAGGQLLIACRSESNTPAPSAPIEPQSLVESNIDNILLPEGFSARVIARSGQPVVEGSEYPWHAAPDGGAVFPVEDGGWIYVSNSEIGNGGGGVGAVRFHASGEIVEAYPILTGTNRNCAGGPTPWNTWLSCEETDDGHVWECDPYGRDQARELPALGAFNHEAVAVDPDTLQLYMTEDHPEGRFYRFTPASSTDGIPDLTSGTLEVAVVNADDHSVSWLPIDAPSGNPVATRDQQPESTVFRGGEGAWYADGKVYFTTKHDNRVWALDTREQSLALIYDDDTAKNPVLQGVDNVTVSQAGVIYVAEDGGNMQIVAIDPEQRVFPVLQVLNHEQSEITGPAFDPSGTRLYFSSQRGAGGKSENGITYEITGPFN